MSADQLKLAFLTFHGVSGGDHITGQGYSYPVRDACALALERAGVSQAHLRWCEVVWADITQGSQDQYWAWAAPQLKLDRLHRLFMDFAGDALADVQALVNARARQQLARIPAGYTVVPVGHSWGAVLALRWMLCARSAALAGLDKGWTDHQRAQTVGAFATLASPLPAVWSRAAAHPRPPQAPRAKADTQWWLNLFDPHDPIGKPLSYPRWVKIARVCRDQQIDVGGLLEGATPAAHTRFWSDPDVGEALAAHVLAVVAR